MNFSVPGKVFLLGEYAVLAGKPAVVAAIPPRFGLGAGRASAHPNSPSGLLLASVGANSSRPLADPHLGSGGFGASTAEFALHYREWAQTRRWSLSAEAVWNRYRDLHPVAGPGPKPSGADLFAQWSGGVVCFYPQNAAASERLSPRSRMRLLVLSTTGTPGRKVATHEHLRELGNKIGWIETATEAVAGPLERGIAAIRAGDSQGLGHAFNAYSEGLLSVGLETPETSLDRAAFLKLPGVLGLKGSGALQSDALVLVLAPQIDDSEREAVLACAKTRGLMVVFQGWPEEEGIRCEP
jgi:mevalonate kinase